MPLDLLEHVHEVLRRHGVPRLPRRPRQCMEPRRVRGCKSQIGLLQFPKRSFKNLLQIDVRIVSFPITLSLLLLSSLLCQTIFRLLSLLFFLLPRQLFRRQQNVIPSWGIPGNLEGLKGMKCPTREVDGDSHGIASPSQNLELDTSILIGPVTMVDLDIPYGSPRRIDDPHLDDGNRQVRRDAEGIPDWREDTLVQQPDRNSRRDEDNGTDHRRPRHERQIPEALTIMLVERACGHVQFSRAGEHTMVTIRGASITKA